MLDTYNVKVDRFWPKTLMYFTFIVISTLSLIMFFIDVKSENAKIIVFIIIIFLSAGL